MLSWYIGYKTESHLYGHSGQYIKHSDRSMSSVPSSQAKFQRPSEVERVDDMQLSPSCTNQTPGHTCISVSLLMWKKYLKELSDLVWHMCATQWFMSQGTHTWIGLDCFMLTITLLKFVYKLYILQYIKPKYAHIFFSHIHQLFTFWYICFHSSFIHKYILTNVHAYMHIHIQTYIHRHYFLANPFQSILKKSQCFTNKHSTCVSLEQ